MWGAGCDCTDDFEEIGHSSLAKSLIGDYLIWNSDTNTNSKTATTTSNNTTTTATSNITTNNNTTTTTNIIASTSTTSHANSMISNLAMYERTKRNRKSLMKVTKYQRQIKIEKSLALRKAYQHIRFKYDDSDVYIGDDFNNDDCIRLQVHSSQPKMYYCPLNQTHYCWYSCCGYSKRIVI